ncbi:MAG: hypothetical protein HZB23_14960 [Deltaproteobacteria bacterium]|nr:hypothetical protein [Deltaproteobacteria bacterium]
MKKNAHKPCCPPFDPEPWDEKEIIWKDKPFVKARVFSIFHIPVNFSDVLKASMEKIAAAGAALPEYLALSDENSLFGADLYIAVAKDVPDVKNEKISATFLTKVFEGPYKNAGKWAAQMKDYAASKGRETSRILFFYTTCPKCAGHYGKNYTVLFAEV